jgi:hypothetical protein
MTDDARQTETNGTATGRQTETTGTMTARQTNTIAGSVPHPTLGDISHANPYTNRAFGDTRTYGRGRPVAADGGEAARPTTDGGRAAPNGGEDRDADRRPDDETLEDVDHTPDDDVDGAQGSFDRGEEAADDEPDDE